ncbi:MAG: dinitrogenase iron-molybdenum cofactor biosynthesis protein [Clostridiales bacterium]|nr:dinitrogenase iron-molybdenum cofactor biosynthesis protein [Candidatus Apopatocola equi]MCQ2439219.1 dinitrogenase iron-molybdenum cofactor biosynthesis protein [Oscillospiraceae bacterium]
MRIAITYEKETGNIFQHFGETECFKVYEIRNKECVLSYLLEAEGTGHEALADFLAANQVDAVLCGGVGGGAAAALNRRGILLLGGVQGTADGAIDMLLHDRLVYRTDPTCDHHDGCEEGCDGCCEDCEDEVFANEI